MIYDPAKERLERRRVEAAEWHARLHADDVSEADYAAFETWAAAPENLQTFDKIDRALAKVALHSTALVEAARSGHAPTRTSWRIARASVLAVCALAAVWLVLALPRPTPWTRYDAPASASRSVELADGSAIVLNRHARIDVALAPSERRVRLEGEAAFEVRHDARRPFTVAVGDQLVRVTGTSFNVLRANHQTVVTVERGHVNVGPADGTPLAVLHPGQQGVHRDGEAGWRVSSVNAANALAWRNGRLVYLDAPLSVVVGDLNRYFDKPVRIGDPRLADMRFTGVLIIDSEEAMLNRLTLFLPVVVNTNDEEAVLSRHPKH